MPQTLKHDTSARSGDLSLPSVDVGRARVNWPAVALITTALAIDIALVGGLFALAYGVRWLLERVS